VAALAWPYFERAGCLPPRENVTAKVSEWFEAVVAVLLPGVDHLDQLPAKAGFLFAFDPGRAMQDPENAAILGSEGGRRVLEAFRARIAQERSPLTAERFKAVMNEVRAETGARGRELFHPVRILLTGAHAGPEFDRIIPLIEQGAALGLGIPGVAERASAF
jgi:glutamyl/glutaminyl-tRNA synthetase